MAKRLKAGDFAADYAKTPGPARYDSVSAELTQPRRPSYSIQARQFMPGGMYTTIILHEEMFYGLLGSDNFVLER